MDIALLRLHRVELGSAALKDGVLIEHIFEALQLAKIAGREPNVGFGELIVRKDDGAVGDEAIGFEHAGEGFGKNRFAGAGFADYRERFVLVDIEGNAADCGEDSSANVEFDFDVLEGQKDFSFSIGFHNQVLLLHMGLGVRCVSKVLTEKVEDDGQHSGIDNGGPEFPRVGKERRLGGGDRQTRRFREKLVVRQR